MDAPERYGSYVVYEQIGKGGMATVHRAEEQLRGDTRQIALKRLNPTMQRELVQLFLDECRLLKYLRHPNIAQTYDSGRMFGTYFIAMEYVRGPTVKELIEHCGSTVGAVPQPIALNLAAQLCDALDHAHNCCDEHGAPLHIVHRDVTPANIIVSDTGLLKLIDFGLAKRRGVSEHTGTGIIKGKFGYVAPEYLAGQLDARADLWAVGIFLYELLTSRRLFDGPDAYETMMRIREMPVPRPSLANPSVTRELDEIVLTALARDPERRWQSAAQMRDRLRAVISQPGNECDNLAIVEWVRHVFEQERGGRAPQLTPIMPVPIDRIPRAGSLGDEEEATIVAEAPVADNEPTVATNPVIEDAVFGGLPFAIPPAHVLDAQQSMTMEPVTHFTWTRANIIWAACAALLVVLLFVGLVAKLVS